MRSPIVSFLSYFSRKAGAIAGRLLVIFFFLAVSDHLLAETRPRNIAQLAVEFVRLFASGRLSVNAAKELIGTEGSVERHGAYWQIGSNSGWGEIILRAENVDESTNDAKLQLRLKSGLILEDLEKAFGPWQLIFSSKTSSVSFRIIDWPDKSALVFVQLFTSKPFPDSPVLSVQLRWDNGTQGHRAD